MRSRSQEFEYVAKESGAVRSAAAVSSDIGQNPWITAALFALGDPVPSPEPLGGDLAGLLSLKAGATVSVAVDVGLLWTELCAGRFRVASSFFNDSSCFLALKSEGNPRPDRRLARRRLHVLEKVLLAGGQKPVAAELGLAPSTVAIIAGKCLRAMGLDCGASRAPLPLALSVHALHGMTTLRSARLSTVCCEGNTYTVVSTPRPERSLGSELSPAEFAVTQLLVEGKSHAEIAAVRQTSVRTVANQLAAAFHKLGVSGRSELICRLINPDFEPATSPRVVNPQPRLQPSAAYRV